MTNNRKNFDENMRKVNTRFIEEPNANHEIDTRNDIPSPERPKSSNGIVIAVASIAMAIAVTIGAVVLFASNANMRSLLTTPSATVATIAQDISPLAPKATEAPKEPATLAPRPTEAPTQAPTAAPTEAPTQAPTDAPTEAPNEAPSQEPGTAPVSAQAI